MKIFVSGGINEESIKTLREAGTYGFGVGTSISNAPTIDFAMDIVEVEGRLSAKRGKLGGRKQVWRCSKCFVDLVKLEKEDSPKCPKCKGSMESMLKPLIKSGKIEGKLPEVDGIREYVLEQISKLDLK